MSLFPQRTGGSWFYRHSLSVVLVTMMVVQTLVAIYDGWFIFSLEEPLGPEVKRGTWEYWTWWRWHYNVSLVADTFGVMLVVLLNIPFREESSEPQS